MTDSTSADISLTAVIAAAVADERERCAKVAEAAVKDWQLSKNMAAQIVAEIVGEGIAAAIRAGDGA
jgi:hypothetical protein